MRQSSSIEYSSSQSDCSWSINPEMFLRAKYKRNTLPVSLYFCKALNIMSSLPRFLCRCKIFLIFIIERCQRENFIFCTLPPCLYVIRGEDSAAEIQPSALHLLSRLDYIIIITLIFFLSNIQGQVYD